MHFGSTKSNIHTTCEVVQEEMDFGITRNRDLKSRISVGFPVRKPIQLLGSQRNTDCKTTEFMSALYNSLVKPYLDYAVQFWRLKIQKSNYSRESFRGGTKVIPLLRHTENMRLY